MKSVGTVSALRRYPVKSMAGEDLESVFLSKFGIEGDRRFAFVDKRAENKAFPWMTARQGPEMLLFRTRWLDSSYKSLEVITPERSTFNIQDENLLRLLETRFKRELFLRIADGMGLVDSMPLSIFGIETAAQIGRETGFAGQDFNKERFRANIYVHWHSREPFYEDRLIGKALEVGDTRVRIVKKDSRCKIPTLDPRTSKETPEILENIARKHGGCAGVYCEIEKEGVLRVGDDVRLS